MRPLSIKLPDALPDAVQLTPQRSMLRWVLVGFVVFAALTIGFLIYTGAASLQTEERLQATLLTTRLVYNYVQDNNRWPTSWRDLETVNVQWPRDSQLLQRYVVIDFTADLNKLARQSPEEFSAIRPNGASYPHQGNRFVSHLQRSLREKGYGQVDPTGNVEPAASEIIRSAFDYDQFTLFTTARLLLRHSGAEGAGKTSDQCVLWLQWEEGRPRWALAHLYRERAADKWTCRTIHTMYTNGVDKPATSYRVFNERPSLTDVRAFLDRWWMEMSWSKQGRSWAIAINRDTWSELIGPVPD
jgi:hypothetical protein